jgi:hypothetical protein
MIFWSQSLSVYLNTVTLFTHFITYWLSEHSYSIYPFYYILAVWTQLLYPFYYILAVWTQLLYLPIWLQSRLLSVTHPHVNKLGHIFSIRKQHPVYISFGGVNLRPCFNLIWLHNESLHIVENEQRSQFFNLKHIITHYEEEEKNV